MTAAVDAALNVGALLFGLLAGYSHASLVESWCHDRIQHARKSTLERYRRFPFFGNYLIDAWRSHAVVHHGMSFRSNHVRQFQSVEHEDRARAYFQKHGLNLANDYGLTVTFGGLVRFMLPFMVLNTVVAIVWPVIVSIPFGLMSLTSPLLSKYAHPYLHAPYQRAQSTAPMLVRLLLRSSLGRAMWIRHFLHHRNPGVCFNLMPPIGDWLRRVTSSANALDLAELGRIGGPEIDSTMGRSPNSPAEASSKPSPAPPSDPSTAALKPTCQSSSGRGRRRRG